MKRTHCYEVLGHCYASNSKVDLNAEKKEEEQEERRDEKSA